MALPDDRRTPDVRGSAADGDSLVARLPGTARYLLRVEAADALTPAMRRLRLGAPELAELDYQPGQDLMVAVPVPDQPGTTFRRRYTIRRLERDAAAVELYVVLHGDGPGVRWARTAAPGDEVEAIGPRGKITLDPAATTHLFCADESALAATAALMEAVPRGRRAVVLAEVDGAGDRPAFDPSGAGELDLHWFHRDGTAPGTSSLLVDALDRLAPAPAGVHAYVAGELAQVAAARRTLTAHGYEPGQLSVKPYWRRGVANAAHGEPENPD
jgi:NADPH-dependent ferric siderophore reductase